MSRKVKPFRKSINTNRHSSVIRVTSVISVVAMVVTAGTILFLFLFDNDKSDEIPIPTVVEEVTSCPADDGSQEQQIAFERRPIWCLENGQTYTAIFNTSVSRISRVCRFASGV